VGAGVGPADIQEAWGVAKAYTTRVGAGPFPTELDDELGAYIRERGGERGTTTGRDRRTGWIDLVALRYAARLNRLSALAVTKLDVLAGIDPIRVAVRYRSSEGARAKRAITWTSSLRASACRSAWSASAPGASRSSGWASASATCGPRREGRARRPPPADLAVRVRKVPIERVIRACAAK
jgi:adenylosuccinate synthase